VKSSTIYPILYVVLADLKQSMRHVKLDATVGHLEIGYNEVAVFLFQLFQSTQWVVEGRNRVCVLFKDAAKVFKRNFIVINHKNMA